MVSKTSWEGNVFVASAAAIYIAKAISGLESNRWEILSLQFFDSVTILFSDVVTFTEICSRLTPIEVVQMLNAMYSLFDQLTDKHGVYKVSRRPNLPQDRWPQICEYMRVRTTQKF